MGQASCRLRPTTYVYVYVVQQDALCRVLATMDLIAAAAGFSRLFDALL